MKLHFPWAHKEKERNYYKTRICDMIANEINTYRTPNELQQ